VALYRNITNKAVYICSDMTKILIQPGAEVELSTRDLCHAGYALASFESVAKAKEVEEKRMASIAKARKFVPSESVKKAIEPIVEPVI